MVSTVDDLDRFFSALNGGRLLPPHLLKDMTTPTPSSGGYGLGYGQAPTPCGKAWGNNGNFMGFNATAYGSAGGKRQVVLFVNLDESNYTPALKKALDAVLLALCGSRPHWRNQRYAG